MNEEDGDDPQREQEHHVTSGLHLTEVLLDVVGPLVEQIEEKTCARRRDLVFHPPVSRRAGGFSQASTLASARGLRTPDALQRRACVGRATPGATLMWARRCCVSARALLLGSSFWCDAR